MQISEEEVIYPNSINRLIIIDKIEYFLSYKHDIITNYTSDKISNDLNIGTLSLISKTISREGKPIQYHIDYSIKI
jgi:hypothetical protein